MYFLLILLFLSFCSAEKLKCSESVMEQYPKECDIDCKGSANSSLSSGKIYKEVDYWTLYNCDITKFPDTFLKDYPIIGSVQIFFNNGENIGLENLQNSTTLRVINIEKSRVKALIGTLCFNCKLFSITISASHLENIAIDAFKGFTKLYSLNLSRNEIEALSVGVFDSLVETRRIDLSYNKLKIIQKDLFLYTVELSDLLLSHNEIFLIEDGAFHQHKLDVHLENNNLVYGQSYNKTSVFLESNNLSSIFIGENVFSVKISNNFVSEINCSSTLSVLHSFQADSNLIENMNCIDRMNNIDILCLTNNSIAHLEAESFTNLTNLSDFRLSLNPILSLDPSTFSPLKSLFMLEVNNLTSYKNLKAQMPGLTLLSLITTTWSCKDMRKTANTLNLQKIRLQLFRIKEDFEKFVCKVHSEINTNI